MKVCSRCQLSFPLEQFTKTSSNCKLCRKEYNKQWRESNQQYLIKYSELNKERDILTAKIYRKNNKDKISESGKNWRNKNEDLIKLKNKSIRSKPGFKESRNSYIKERRKINPKVKIADQFRLNFYNWWRKNLDGKNMEFFVGCSREDFKKHIESTFLPGMSWENYGEWEIDHIKPYSNFDFNKSEEQKLCMNYSNTRALWSLENKIKNKFKI